MVTIDDAKVVAANIARSVKPQLTTVFGFVARESRGNDLDLLVVVADQHYEGFSTEAMRMISRLLTAFTGAAIQWKPVCFPRERPMQMMLPVRSLSHHLY